MTIERAFAGELEDLIDRGQPDEAARRLAARRARSCSSAIVAS